MNSAYDHTLKIHFCVPLTLKNINNCAWYFAVVYLTGHALKREWKSRKAFSIFNMHGARYDYSGPSYIYLTEAKENTTPRILLTPSRHQPHCPEFEGISNTEASKQVPVLLGLLMILSPQREALSFELSVSQTIINCLTPFMSFSILWTI